MKLQHTLLTKLLVLLLTSLLSTTSFAMTNLKNQPTSIDAYKGKGKWLIVQAWSSRCSICNKAMPGLVKASHSFPNARLVGVSLDGNIRAAQGFINKHHINFPTIVSNNNEFNAYMNKVAGEGLHGTPTFLIFDPQGRLKALQPGNVPPTTLQNFLMKMQGR